MSQEDLQKFLEAVREDPSLQKKLEAAGDADGAVAVAQAAGFTISAQKLKQAEAELSEEDLEEVAGGSRAHRIASHHHCAHHRHPEVVVDENGHHWLAKYYTGNSGS